MSLRHTITDALNIRPGEGDSIALLSSYSFLAGICLAYVISLGNAFFLVEFGPEYLAPGYIVTGVVGYITGSLLSFIQRRIAFTKLVRLIIIFLFVLTCMFRIGFWFAPDRPLIWGFTTGQLMAGGMFVSIGTYIMLVYFVFRSLLGRLFNLRQGKRLFGLISTGDVISSIIGFFSVPLLLRFFPNAADLLFIASGSLLLCLWVLSMITRRFSAELDMQPKKRDVQLQSGFSDLIKTRYFVLFFLLSAASVFGFYYIDYAFLGQLRVRFPDKAQLAQFIGIFYGVIRIVEFILKTFLSGWLISQYGLRFGLVVLPLLLCITSALAALSGTLLANATSAVFLLIALSKLIERVITKSLYDPSFNILYQSIDTDLRLSVQTKIEGIVQQLAAVLAGLTLLFFNQVGSFQLVSYVLILIFAGWVIISIFMYRAYRNTLLQNLSQQVDENNTSAALTEVSSWYLLNEQLDSESPDQIISALDILEKIAPSSLDPVLEKLLSHPSSQVRQQAMQTVVCLASPTMLNTVQKCLDTESDPSVHELATQALEVLTDIRTVGQSPQTVAIRAQSDGITDRITASKALCTPQADTALLSRLLEDTNPDVRRKALISAGQTEYAGFWLHMVSHLSSPAFGNSAASALVDLGPRVLPILQATFSEPGQTPQTLAKIVRIHGQIGGNQAVLWLADRLNFWNQEVRHQILLSLKLCGYHAQDEQIARVKEEIKDAVDNAAWCMSALRDLGDDNTRLDRLKSFLGTEIDQNRERVFHLLSLIYDAQQIRLVHHNFKSGSTDGKAYALELIDLFIEPELKVLLIPLLDDLTLAQRLKRLDPYCPQQHLNLEGRLKDIVNRQPAKIDRWAKACALHAFPSLPSPTVADELVATLCHPDPLLRETAASSICEIDPIFLKTYIQGLPEKNRPNLDQAFQIPDHHNDVWLTIEKVAFLKTVPFFAHIPEHILVTWASALREKHIEPEETIIFERNTQNNIYLIIEGQVRIHTGAETVATVEKGDALGNVFALGLHMPAESATANNAVKLGILDQDIIYDFIADHVQVAQGIIHATNTQSVNT